MKTLKFRHYLVPIVSSGEKTSTWRLFDDKNLSRGDKVELQEFVTNKPFAKATITKTIEKAFEDLTDEDMEGHERFSSDAVMYQTYSKYYKTNVTPKTQLKVIHFKLDD